MVVEVTQLRVRALLSCSTIEIFIDRVVSVCFVAKVSAVVPRRSSSGSGTFAASSSSSRLRWNASAYNGMTVVSSFFVLYIT